MSQRSLPLTIGMACHDDYHGVWLTVQSLMTYHQPAMENVELVIVDNSPASAHGKAVQDLMGWLYGKTPEGIAKSGGTDYVRLGGLQYVPFTEVNGTSAPRDKVFRVAKGDFVLCVDSHVMLAAGSVERLIREVGNKTNSLLNDDLVSGPMLYDDGVTYSTHFDDVWRGQMWGTWATAWSCPHCKRPLSVRQSTEGSTLQWTDMKVGSPVTAKCPECGRDLPQGVPWAGHEAKLASSGFRRTADRSDAAFEIPAMGLGLFGCRREAWLGFNPEFRGFGGEEHYIHEKYRQAGRKNLCFPWLKWLHRFGRPDGVKYPLNVWNKVRNYVIGHAELGLPFDRIKAEFVPRLMPVHEWDQLVASPLHPPLMPVLQQPVKAAEPGCGGCGQTWEPPAPNVDQWLEFLKGQQHDFRGHEDLLREMAWHQPHVTELGGRRGSSTVCLAAGHPGVLRIIDPQPGHEWNALAAYAGRNGTRMEIDNRRSEVAEPRPTDVLLIDTNHYADQLWAELLIHGPHVRKRIVIHDTVLHEHHGEGGKLGLSHAIKRWVREHPEWTVIKHDRQRYGLMVLSKDPDDKKPLPGLLKQTWNYAQAMVGHVRTGMKTVTEEQLKARLETCDLCPSRVENRCGECGCYLDNSPVPNQNGKARMADQDCPLGKWPLLPKETAQ